MAVKNRNVNETASDTEVTAIQTETPAPVAEKSKAKTPVEKAGVFVYIGPSIKGLVQEGTVYRSTYTGVLQKLDYAVSKYPLIKNLVVSGETLAADRQDVHKSGSLLNQYYNKIAEKA